MVLRRCALALVVTLLVATPASSVTRRWVATGNGAMGSWTNGSLWIPAGIPEPGDDLLLTDPGNYSCDTNGSFEPRTLVIGGGSGIRSVEVSAGTTLTTLLSTKFNFNSNITVRGTLDGGGSITINQGGTVQMMSGSALDGTGEFVALADSTFVMGNCEIRGKPVSLGGTATLSGIATMTSGAQVTNSGTAVLTGGIARGDSSKMSLENSGQLTIKGSNISVGVDVTNSGTVAVQSGTFNVSTASYKQTGGMTSISAGATLAGPVEISAGTLAGSGTVNGSVNNSGTIALATPVSFAALQINGDFRQLPSGRIEIKIGSASQFDRLLISGLATLAGQISITFLNGFSPANGDEFPILTFGSRAGDFSFYDGVDLGDLELVPVYTPNGLTLATRVKEQCPEGRLCMNEGRFEVSLAATDPRTGNTGVGAPKKQNDIFGYFSIPDLTSNPTNPEVFVKVLDGRPVNGKFWVFYGSLTDFELTLTIVDTETRTTRSYEKPGYSTCGEYDVRAFDESSTFAVLRADMISTELNVLRLSRPPYVGVPEQAPSGCVASQTSLCVLDSRFAVTLQARDQRTDRTATGQAIPQNDLFGYFTLPELTNNPGNVEVFVKVLDGRPINGKFWVFFGGLTDFEYTLKVTDGVTFAQKTYTKEAGSPCGLFDTEAF